MSFSLRRYALNPVRYPHATWCAPEDQTVDFGLRWYIGMVDDSTGKLHRVTEFREEEPGKITVYDIIIPEHDGLS